MPERWIVNGVDLNTLAWKIESGKGLGTTPGIRSLDVEVPGRHGSLASARRSYTPGRLELSMWVQGVDPVTGLVGDEVGGLIDEDASLDAYYARVDELLAVFHAPTLTVEHVRPNGDARQATGQITAEMDFTREPSSPVFGRFMVQVAIHDAFWFDTEDTTQTLTLTDGQTGHLWAFEGATAPMDGLDITILGGANPQLTDANSGAWVAYDEVFGEGKGIRLDCADRYVYSAGGFYVDQSRVRHGGARGRLFELSPGAPPAVTLTCSDSEPVQITVTGRRAYLAA